ncbi:uncharacterized protein LOC142131999 [Mixophyes fleayi]|uniref:uncharacterized protein LOC142131999 n=1 Tax=Mixophyes fleayi TaxID=3061075 RepID=UPI003F4E2B26
MTEPGNKIKDRHTVQVIASSSIRGKVRRRRTVYNQFHMDLLLKAFEINPYPGISLREKLAHLTGVHESRIQVWFQNRRARKSKKKEQEGENLPQQVEWQQCNQVPQVSNPQPEKECYKMGYNEKQEYINKNCALPFQSLSHLHMNSVVGPQHHNSWWPTHHQVINSVTSTVTTAQQYHPYMQPVSSSHLQHPTCILETSGTEYSTTFVNSKEPVHGATQELSLLDILEEFQPFWTEQANSNFTGVTDDLL